MSETASHDVSELRGTGGQLRQIAQAAQSSSVAMVVDMVALKCWGADKIGQAFAGVYLEGASQVMDHILDTGPHIGQIADTLSGSSDSYADTEQVNADAADQVVQA